jgi:hypothetical protein
MLKRFNIESEIIIFHNIFSVCSNIINRTHIISQYIEKTDKYYWRIMQVPIRLHVYYGRL